MITSVPKTLQIFSEVSIALEMQREAHCLFLGEPHTPMSPSECTPKRTNHRVEIFRAHTRS